MTSPSASSDCVCDQCLSPTAAGRLSALTAITQCDGWRSGGVSGGEEEEGKNRRDWLGPLGLVQGKRAPPGGWGVRSGGGPGMNVLDGRPDRSRRQPIRYSRRKRTRRQEEEEANPTWGNWFIFTGRIHHRLGLMYQRLSAGSFSANSSSHHAKMLKLIEKKGHKGNWATAWTYLAEWRAKWIWRWVMEQSDAVE